VTVLSSIVFLLAMLLQWSVPIPVDQPGAADGGRFGSLVVQIHGCRSADGHVRVYVFDRARGFPAHQSSALRASIGEIQHGRSEVRFEGLPLGVYAVAIHHDENDDGRMNRTVFRMPREGYGVSNNVVHRMRAPHFDEARFALDSGVHVVNIKVHY
jgi:uncharacterized protein (DUF2141 family)